MTYFRYDNNRRGFDMAGIEWDIQEIPTHHTFTAGGGKWAVVAQTVEIESDEKYNTSISRNGQYITTLDEMDTARFIRHISKDDTLGRPNVPQSCVTTIEEFLSAGDRV